ncbi:MAG: MBL fold metallo-hydrolase [Desulfomonile sp.]|nr:MBL fold metallo-hydrolase [Desulfomonile sp.]
MERLAGELYLVPGEGNARFPACHGFLLRGSDTVLIDAGMGLERIRELDRQIRIDILIISHSHPDHIRMAYLLQDRHIMMPKESPEEVSDLFLLGERFTGSKEAGEYWARAMESAYGVQAVRPPDARFGDGDVLDFGAARLLAVYAPGHLKDHYCFLELTTGTLLTTDIDLTGFGPWYGNPEADIETFHASIHKVMSLPYSRVCSSHRLPIEGDATDNFLTFLQGFVRHREAVMQICRRPSTLDDILAVSPLYGDAFPDKFFQHLFERNMSAKILALLIRDGIVEESGGRYQRVSGEVYQ